MKIHNDTEEACAQDSFEDFLVETPFEVFCYKIIFVEISL